MEIPEQSGQHRPPASEAMSVSAGPVGEGMARMMDHYDAHGFPGGNALVLRSILGREPRTLKQFFQEAATQ